MTPLYIPAFFKDPRGNILGRLDASTTWLHEADTRSECFMSSGAERSYTYGKGRGERTYTSVQPTLTVVALKFLLNQELKRHGFGPMNVCFLNRYEGERQHLGWHADDHPGTDHSRPIVSVSFGEPREIWWRALPCSHCSGTRRLASMHGDDEKFDSYECPTCHGEKPEVHRQLLEHGSLFIMPPGMQQTHQHRIPKGDRKMGTRISLTFRAFL